MAYFLLGDEVPDDPVMRESGLDGMGLWSASAAFAMHHFTEGFVPDYYVKSWPGGRKAATKLVKLGIWAPVNGGFHFVSWSQRTKKQVEAEREAARLRQQKHRGSAKGNPQADGEEGGDVTP